MVLGVSHLTQYFKLSRNSYIPAVDDVSFHIAKGEIFGLVGESGSGKSTFARCVMNIYEPTGGHIYFDGIDTCDKKLRKQHRKKLASERQIIFQDSSSSLNRRMKVADIISEPMRIMHIRPPKGSYYEEARFQLSYVGLDESYLKKTPGQLSGGERQRVAIARAVSMEPKLLVADEPISSLDVTTQAQIAKLFLHLRKEHGFSILFIGHDLSMIEYLCDRVGVMYRGRLVETAPRDVLFKNPVHSYTRSLLSAMPYPDPDHKRERIIYDGSTFDRKRPMEKIEEGHFVVRE